MNHALSRNRRQILVAAAWAASTAASAQAAVAAAIAEDLAQQLAQAAVQIERHVIFDDGADHLAMAVGELAGTRVVKAAPYCADAVHESVQWLADGTGAAPNRIVRQQVSRLCRDGEGRTRQEVERNGRKRVYLGDPVAGESWVLDPEQKTARRIGTSPRAAMAHPGGDTPAMREFSERMRDYAERMRDWARGLSDNQRQGRTPPTPPTPPAGLAPLLPPTPALPALIARGDGATHQAEVRILRLNAAEAADWAVPPPVQWRIGNLAPRGPGSVTPLPGREIEGVRASGERTTWVIEAGKLGNERPIQITREVWTAPELMLTLSSRDFDPRSGEVSYRLKGLKRGEPDAALMRVPSDYKQPARPGSQASQPMG